MKHNRHKRPIIPRRGRQLQSANGVGHRDMVVQSKRWLLFGTVPFSNILVVTGGNDFAFGYRDINIGTAAFAGGVYNRLMNTAALTYEEYRVRRVVIRAQPGTGMSNDDRIKTSVFARVDVNSQPTVANTTNLNTLISSESSVNKTFTERSNIKLLDYRPICYSSGGSGASSRPLLPSQYQWYNIDERNAHIWRGGIVAPLIADGNISPNSKDIVCWCEVEVEFRSRRPDFSALSLATPSFEALDSQGGAEREVSD